MIAFFDPKIDVDFLNFFTQIRKAMFKRDPLLKGWDLEPDKNSKNYKEMKAMLDEFEKEYQLQQKQLSKFYSISYIHYKFNPGPSCPI